MSWRRLALTSSVRMTYARGVPLLSITRGRVSGYGEATYQPLMIGPAQELVHFAVEDANIPGLVARHQLRLGHHPSTVYALDQRPIEHVSRRRPLSYCSLATGHTSQATLNLP